MSRCKPQRIRVVRVSAEWSLIIHENPGWGDRQWPDELALYNASITDIRAAHGGLSVGMELDLWQSTSAGAAPSVCRGGLAAVQITVEIREACNWSGSNEATRWVPSTPCPPSSAWVFVTRLGYYVDLNGRRTALSHTAAQKVASTSRLCPDLVTHGSGRAAFLVSAREIVTTI